MDLKMKAGLRAGLQAAAQGRMPMPQDVHPNDAHGCARLEGIIDTLAWMLEAGEAPTHTLSVLMTMTVVHGVATETSHSVRSRMHAADEEHAALATAYDFLARVHHP